MRSGPQGPQCEAWIGECGSVCWDDGVRTLVRTFVRTIRVTAVVAGAVSG